MKKLTFAVFVIFVIGFSIDFIIGDKATNPAFIDNQNLIKGRYIVFLDREFNQKNTIAEFARSKGISLETKQIFTEGRFGFVAELDSRQVEKLKGWFYWTRWFTKVAEIQEDFSIQSTRARMQSDPIPQNTRARMQSDYNDSLYTAYGVVYVGGPLVPPNFSRKVWVIDTGIDGSHQDLQGQVVTSGGFAISYVSGETDPYSDGNGHGTFCAGLIGAKSTNSADSLVRMNGVAPGAKLVSVKVLDSKGEGSWGKVYLGLSYALAKSTEGDIISMSLGGDYPNACSFFNSSFFNAFKQAVLDKGVFVVMSAGNLDENESGITKQSSFNFPGCIQGENFITVGSITLKGVPHGIAVSDFSYIGIPSIDFVAPGNRVFSTTINNQYELRSGTSVSTAIVSGIIYAKGGMPNGTDLIWGNGTDTNNYPIAKVQ